VLEQLFENAIAVLMDDIVHFREPGWAISIVRKMERARTLVRTMARTAEAIGSMLFGNLRACIFAEGAHTLGEISRRVAVFALEVIGDFPERRSMRRFRRR